MIVDLLFKLIDRCIQLGERKEKTKRNLFTDFVEPVYEDFQKVHEEYLASYRKYREIIRDKEPAELLEDTIKEDILFSNSSRARIRDLEKWATDPILGDFISSIVRYVRQDSSWEPRDTSYLRKNFVSLNLKELSESIGRMNMPRISFMDIAVVNLRNPSNSIEKKREAALLLTKVFLEEQQRYYDDVLWEVRKLKESLLSP